MTKRWLTDERLADIREWFERDRTRWPVGDLLAEIDYHREKDAELYRLAQHEMVSHDPRFPEDVDGISLAETIIDKCGPPL